MGHGWRCNRILRRLHCQKCNRKFSAKINKLHIVSAIDSFPDVKLLGSRTAPPMRGLSWNLTAARGAHECIEPEIHLVS